MIRSLKLTNFRRFEEHELSLRPTTVVVGANNAGKSTIVEALRLVSFVANRYRSLHFQKVPTWLSVPAGTYGVAPSLRDLSTNLRTVFHAFQDPPARISAQFEGGVEISVYIGPDEQVFAVVRDAQGRVLNSKSMAHSVIVPRIAIQPQVAPLALAERTLDPGTVRRGLDSPLAPSHFRNQLRLLGPEAFGRFKVLAETTWPGLQIQNLEGGGANEEDSLALFVRDGPFVGEASSMGHGLQMWLQVMWFLARNEDAPTMILDEPDVYMHADLQRKLMRLLCKLERQVIVATHSVEIMAEVEPGDILVVNGTLKKSKWANNISGVQRVIDNIGGVHNVQLSRLAHARRCLFVEGDDLDILKRFHDRLFPEADALDVLPKLSVGGWGGWQRVLGTAQFLRNASGGAITSYCILDSDYHLPSEVLARYAEADEAGIQLQIWTRKELENFLLVASAVHRILSTKSKRSRCPDINDVEQALLAVAEEAIDETADGYATAYSEGNKGTAVGTANKWGRNFVKKRRAEPDGLFDIIPGKTVLLGMSAWAEGRWGVTFGPTAVARQMLPGEIASEVHEVLTAIEEREPFPGSSRAKWTDRL